MRTRLVAAALCLAAGWQSVANAQSVARQWNEENLHAIRNDFARPTIHARNLYHVSCAMWDAWCAFGGEGTQILHVESMTPTNLQADREEAISYAAYRLLVHRYQNSPGSATTLPALDALMGTLGYNIAYTNTVDATPAALGNRIAATIIAHGLADGSNEANEYENIFYLPINPPLLPDFAGNPDIIDQNRWQPLALKWFKDQAGIEIGEYPDFLSPEWGTVTPFALDLADLTIHSRDGDDYWVYHDPGDPPFHDGVGDAYYKWGNEMVVTWSKHLDPTDGVMWNISPNSIGNSPLPGVNDWATYYDKTNGNDWGTGYAVNPVTGLPYADNIVPRGDYTRVLAEFWADGPDSETPPGHWFSIANYVSDHAQFQKRMSGQGPVLPDLEWDVKVYLAMGGAMHDVAISAWGCKGAYDYIRPISAIRFIADLGQSSDPLQPSYDVRGITLIPGTIEVVTAATTAPGQHHEHLTGHEGKIAINAWLGPTQISDPATDTAGVGWMLAENWWPYQRPTFVTPPFAGYVSGHSTYSRCAADLMTSMTGTAYFPGGLGEFFCAQNQFLVFEEGPSVDITLQWATYQDASDQCSLSRIWGGIHPPADDIPGRLMGGDMAIDAWAKALVLYGTRCNSDWNGDGIVLTNDFIAYLNDYNAVTGGGSFVHGDPDVAVPYGTLNTADFLAFLNFISACPPMP